MREKAEFLKLFNWVINRAKHHAHHTGKPIDEILTEWESQRDYWWLNFYKTAMQSKFHSGSRKKMSLKGTKKFYKKQNYSKEYTTTQVLRFIAFQQKEGSTKTKPRCKNGRRW